MNPSTSKPETIHMMRTVTWSRMMVTMMTRPAGMAITSDGATASANTMNESVRTGGLSFRRQSRLVHDWVEYVC